MFKQPQSVSREQVNDQAFLDSLPIGSLISSTGGGRGQGHVQIKIDASTWASDTVQSHLLTNKYDNFTVHAPNEQGLAALAKQGVQQKFVAANLPDLPKSKSKAELEAEANAKIDKDLAAKDAAIEQYRIEGKKQAEADAKATVAELQKNLSTPAMTGLPPGMSFAQATGISTPGDKTTTTPTQYAQAPTGGNAAPAVTTPNTNYNQPIVSNPTPQQAQSSSSNSDATMTISLAQLFQETLAHTTALSASLDGTAKNMTTLASNSKDAAKAIK